MESAMARISASIIMLPRVRCSWLGFITGSTDNVTKQAFEGHVVKVWSLLKKPVTETPVDLFGCIRSWRHGDASDPVGYLDQSGGCAGKALQRLTDDPPDALQHA